MRSPLKSRSRFPSSTSLALGLALAQVACAGCGDDTCGPMGASSTGLTVSAANVELVYENLTSLAGNDCPDPDAPEGVISISIEGHQKGHPERLMTFCLPRMDLFTPGSGHNIGVSMSNADVQIFDLFGEDENCTYAFDRSQPPLGNVGGIGVCGNGDDSAGFALDFDANLTLRRTCGATIDSVPVQLTGTIAVAKRS